MEVKSEVERFEGLVGKRYGRLRVREIRGKDGLVDELHTVYVQRIMWR